MYMCNVHKVHTILFLYVPTASVYSLMESRLCVIGSGHRYRQIVKGWRIIS